MAKDELDSQLEPESLIRITSVPRDRLRLPGRRCAETTLAAMQTPSKTARKGFESAARWFALAVKR